MEPGIMREWIGGQVGMALAALSVALVVFVVFMH